jgi:hypothetical protein
MLASVKVKAAERLLSEGKLSHRKIARAVGISRASVGAIALGRRPDYEARQLERAAQVEPLGPLARCPQCGGMVYTPCRLCRVRALLLKEQETARAMRKRARELALKRLVAAVWKASQTRDATDDGRHHFPAPADGGDASDCK